MTTDARGNQHIQIQPLTKQPIIVRPINNDEIETCGQLLGTAFADELWNRTLVEVLADPVDRDAFLKAASTNDVKGFARHGGVFVAESPDGLQQPAGLMIIVKSDQIPAEEYERIFVSYMEAGLAQLSEGDQALIKARLERIDVHKEESWLPRWCPDGYAYLVAVAVAKAYRKQGVFDALFDTQTTVFDALGLPICLETYAKPLVTYYESKGFDLVDMVTFEPLPLIEYRMVRTPPLLL